MKELRDKKILGRILGDIRAKTAGLSTPVRIMEVCGTHTMALHRSGLTAQLEEAGIEMISGPGCPVCITPDGIHEAAIRLVSGRERTILATFGDMTKVPTRFGSIQTAIPAPESSIKIVYSPEEALSLAERNPEKEVVFFGAGFETTIPSIAFTIRRARREKRRNFSVLRALWLIPPALKALLESGDCAVSGFLYPGHVSVIIGEAPYKFIPRTYGLSGAITGFEPADILIGVRSVIDQIATGSPRVANAYERVVRPEGNPIARSLIRAVFEPCDAVWRGLGAIPASGLKLKKAFGDYDAEAKFDLETAVSSKEHPGCRCGEVLRGMIRPPDCRLFGKACRPDSPLGPCMVSAEGACLIHHKFAGTGKQGKSS